MEKSIRELGCEYLDLCLVHWPEAQKPGTFEPDTGVSMQETWCAAAPDWGRHTRDGHRVCAHTCAASLCYVRKCHVMPCLKADMMAF